MEAKKVLVVDDEEIIRDMLQEALNRGGYEVRLAGSAEEGMDILRKESIMVMFLDLNLPGMNGVELCKRIRKKNKLSIIYALTGYSNLFGLIECRDAGFDDFFTKPASIELLLEAAQDAFKKMERWEVNDYDLV
jgi:DNA-binding response OmpR family regulator